VKYNLPHEAGYLVKTAKNSRFKANLFGARPPICG
jgi:hypothetical protein